MKLKHFDHDGRARFVTFCAHRRLPVLTNNRFRRIIVESIDSEESLWQKVNYCHYNPVKRGLVREPEDYQWSSYRWWQGKEDVLLTMDIDRST